MQPSADDAVQLAEAVGTACIAELGDACLAVFLHGSLALGGYLPGRSDIDLLAVTAEPLDQLAPAALTARLERLRPGAAVDLRLVTADTARASTPTPEVEAYLRVEPGGVRRETERWPERDLVVEFSVCRAHGLPLFGEQPASLIEPVPDEWVTWVGDAQLADWQAIGDDPEYAELTVFTACRVWLFAEERRHVSKEDAAEWVLGRDPSLAAARSALAARRGHAALIEAVEVQRLLALVRQRIQPALG